MIIVGLTGSIGMGKSTTAKMFKDAGAYVFGADKAVHNLYAKEGKAVPLLRAVFPDIIEDGAVNRKKLSRYLQADPLQIQVLESFIHPMVAEMRAQAIVEARRQGAKVFIADIPLLFETVGENLVDKIVVVSANQSIQKKRVLEREGMTVDKFNMIKNRQLPDAEKRTRADYIIETDKGLSHARAQVFEIMAALTDKED